MKKVFLVLIFSASVRLFGQYSAFQIPYNPDPLSAGTGVVLGDDQYSGVIAIPFPFCFYGTTFNSLVIGSNGIVSFNVAAANTYCSATIPGPMPGPGAPVNSILAPWMDLYPPAGGSIRHTVYGTAPNRRFVISYNNVAMYSCVSNLVGLQVVLYETSNYIDLIIHQVPPCAWNGGARVQGIVQNSTTGFIIPGHNYPGSWLVTDEAWRLVPTAGPCLTVPLVNSISGRLYADVNASCTFDAGDYPLANVPVMANNGSYYAWSDANGNYVMATSTGNYQVSHLPPGQLAVSCPAGGSYNVTLGPGASASNIDFADTAMVYCPDLTVDLGTTNMSRCQNEYAGISYQNIGSYPDSNVVITLSLIDSLGIVNASLPYTQAGNNYSFNVGTLMPGQFGQIAITLSVGCDSSGTIYCMSASIAGASLNDCHTGNNFSEDCHALIAAFDPNEKWVASQQMPANGWVQTEMIESGDELSYQINFQNTGNDTAFTVAVMDTLSAFLEEATVVQGAASAPYQMIRIGNVLRFEFENINLPDSNTNEPASHGFVKFKVQQVPGNPDGTLIENRVSIYFDQNPPIVTNTTENLVCDNPPVAATAVQVSSSLICMGDVVTLSPFGGSAGPTGQWEWHMNDTISTQESISPTYAVTVNAPMTIYVQAVSACGETEFVSVSITPQALAEPATSIALSQQVICLGDTVTLTPVGGNQGAGQWEWFENDTLGLQAAVAPSHSVIVNAPMTVYVQAVNDCGESQFTSVLLNPLSAPVADFNYSVSNGTVTFDDLSSDATEWSWSFGDGNSDNTSAPVHTYLNSGTYTVTLIITGDCGADTLAQSVNVVVAGMDENVAGGIILYPNPNEGQFSLGIPGNGNISLRLTDASGRLVYENDFMNSANIIEVDLGESAKGYFLLEVKGDNWQKVFPVVVR